MSQRCSYWHFSAPSRTAFGLCVSFCWCPTAARVSAILSLCLVSLTPLSLPLSLISISSSQRCSLSLPPRSAALYLFLLAAPISLPLRSAFLFLFLLAALFSLSLPPQSAALSLPAFEKLNDRSIIMAATSVPRRFSATVRRRPLDGVRVLEVGQVRRPRPREGRVTENKREREREPLSEHGECVRQILESARARSWSARARSWRVRAPDLGEYARTR